MTSAVELWRLTAIASFGAVLLTGCYDGLHGGPGLGEGDGGGSSGAGSDESGEAEEGDDESESPPKERESSPGVRLLTQREVQNSVRDLLGVSLDRSLIPREQLVDGHGHISWAQGAGFDDVERYYELGREAAGQAVPLMEPGCALDTLDCASAVAEDFLYRAFRGTGTAEQRQYYLSILEAPEAGETIPERLETLIATALSSPSFLYRRELGDEPVDGSAYVRWLTDHEIASRLSFLVWQSGPDQALLEAAEAGELRDPQMRLVQLGRMLDDERARVGQVGFVIDWMGAEAGGRIGGKDPEILQGTSPALEALADQSLERTIQDVLFDGAGSFAALLGTERYWVEQELAALLGLPPVGEGFEARELDPNVRRGLLMHPTVLAAHTKESGASPFPVGKFVYENVLCEVIGPPLELPEVDDEPPEDQTLREQLEELTKATECQACHVRIGPPGFAFLAFDPIGRHSFTDGLGRPYDTTGTVPVADTTVTFDNAAQLAEALSQHDHTARCVARRLFRWTYGYFEGLDVAPYMNELADESIATQADMRELLTAIIGSDQFAQVRLGG